MPCPLSESWNTCAEPWKLETTVAGRRASRSICLDRVDRLPERSAGRQIERDRDRRLVALVVDQQRPDRRREPRHRLQRHRLAARGLQIDPRQRRDVGLEFRLALQDHLIVVVRRVDGRHLARAEGVEQLLAHLIDGDAVDRRLLAVDLDVHLRIAQIEVGADVTHHPELGDLGLHLRRNPIERVGVARCQRVLVFALRRTSADVEVLHGAETHDEAGHRIGSGRAQALDDRLHALLALVARLERDEDAAAVGGRSSDRPDRPSN